MANGSTWTLFPSEWKVIPPMYIPYVIHLELLFNIVSPFVNLYFLLLLRRPFFHLNLRLLLAHVSIVLILMSLSKIVLDVHSLVPYLHDLPYHIFSLTESSFQYGSVSVSVLISVERLIATVLADRYEKVRVVWLTVFVVLLSSVWNVSLTYFSYSCLRTEHKTRPGALTDSRENDRVVIAVTCAMILNVFGVSGFFFIGRHNRNHWRAAMERKLSHRYQIMENIRTARQLLIVLLIAFFALYFYIVLLYVLITADRSFIADILVQILDLLFAICAIVFPCLLIRTHPRMWKVAKRQILRRSKVGEFVRSKKALRGKGDSDEGAIYFRQLEASWK
ncbi:hypothetical protein QR680_016886 [Steinernema hermaphroditum]|uniref:Uncharacterized protein n=1 Tax=Steinernema hermaphroditum TaxID=289476 RepID=A0AA39LMP1_9BILA|nr:hypothetical protein QR680_016886 [Steinernema hermaphroditum]